MTVRQGDKAKVIAKGNLHTGETGTVAKVQPGLTHPVTVQFPDGSRSHYKQEELEKK